MKRRRAARELALQVLFSLDYNNLPLDEILGSHSLMQDKEQQIQAYAHELIAGAMRHRDEIDTIIGMYCSNWKLSRMAAVDRNILRIAVYELLFNPEVPLAVCIDEAVEIGKKYGSEESGSFVNGVLDKISRSGIRGKPKTAD